MMTESVDMRVLMIVIGIGGGFTFCLVLCLAFLWGKQWAPPRARDERRPPRLQAKVLEPDSTTSDFIHSLEAAQRRLESLLSRAEAAEQKLSSLVTHPDVGKPDAYTTASFLLANGEDVNRVARRLQLSPTQVRLVQELRQELEDKTDDGTEAKEERMVRMQKQPWEKNGISHGEMFAVGRNGVRSGGK